MIVHEQTLLSEDIFDKNFICDLNKCKGACCIEGDFGAPLSITEVAVLEAEIDHIKSYLTPLGLEHIEKYGVWEKDKDGDIVTTCLPTGECNFAVRDENGTLGCGIEHAWRDEKTTFRKPISCHLYPIRISTVGEFDALNYNQWNICKPACTLGNKHQMPVYQFLKEALVRHYGDAWYTELDAIAQAYYQSK
jgi:hypothetical protein